MTCDCCSAKLRPHETITCNPCAIRRIEDLLGSEDWMAVRGPFMADDLRRELAGLKASEEAQNAKTNG